MSQRRARLRISPLGRDITLMLVIKAIALYLIWLAWFSSPPDKNLDAARVGNTLLSAPHVHKDANHAEP
ncbi:MAG TPA: hypothetical protein VLV32_06870 [Burkholderiales bacterium]|nr:hypothetical protein [Burkholderiales bacterium]